MSASIVHPRSLRLFAAIGATLIGLAVGSNGWAGDTGRRHETWNWSGTLAAGRTLEINGVNGRIEAEPSTGNRVEVVADKSGKRHDPAEVKMQVVQDSDGITICAVYPGAGNACTPGESHSHTRNNDVQVDFTVRVPAGVTFSANTVNGEIHTRSLGGPIKAHTVNGGCVIETSQSGEASTVNGSVHATLGRITASDRLDFSTVNGSITLNLPRQFDAELEGSTVNGSIETDFPVTVQGKWGPRTMHGTIGHGGAKLNASTVNGSIRLSQLSQ
jgi:hypothetical protein